MLPDEYAAGFTADIEIAAALSPRYLAALAGKIGASDFDCRERLRRRIARVPHTDAPPKWAAHVGSAIDAFVKKIRKEANPRLLIDEEIVTQLPNGYEITVHPDEIDPDEPSVTDLKSKDGLAAIRGGFTEDANRRQRHIQFFSAAKKGIVPPEGIVRNVFVDRSGNDPEPHVEQEPFSMEAIREATEFLDDALYAVEHNEEAFKDKPRYYCRVACEWFRDCRGKEVESGRLTHPDEVQRVHAYHAAAQRAKDAKALMAALRAEGLEGLSGETDAVRITSTWINATNRSPYWRMETESLGEAS